MVKTTSAVDARLDKLIFCELLPEMFKRVGLKEEDINNLTKTPQWFTTNNWSEKDEADFVEWVTASIQKKLKLPKLQAKRQAQLFVLNYGWSTGVEKQLELDLGE